MAQILVVDDEPIIAMTIADWLDDLGHSSSARLRLVERAGAGRTGARRGDSRYQSRPHTTRAMAWRLTERGVPFAVASGHDAETWTPLSAGVLLPKPFGFETFRQVVDQLLRGCGVGGRLTFSQSQESGEKHAIGADDAVAQEQQTQRAPARVPFAPAAGFQPKNPPKSRVDAEDPERATPRRRRARPISRQRNQSRALHALFGLGVPASHAARRPAADPQLLPARRPHRLSGSRC